MLTTAHPSLWASSTTRPPSLTHLTDPTGTVGTRLHDEGMTDDEPALITVCDRLIAAGLSDERIEEHMTAERVRVDGEPVTDLDAPAPTGTRVVVWGE